MRIAGFFRPDDHAPYVIATVVQQELTLNRDVRFLVDSGASSTVISDSDAVRMGIDYGRLYRLREGITGVGGTVETFVLPSVMMVFRTESETHEERMERIYVLRHSVSDPTQQARIERIPSLLGRDFLNQYTVLLKQSDGTVLITDQDVAV